MTLVGIVDADLGLANGDPRAAERTFQLLSQVTGRAGRHRFRLLVHGDRRSDIQKFVRTILATADRPRGSVRVQVDIDPQSFL
jgi:primosomal protein N'